MFDTSEQEATRRPSRRSAPAVEEAEREARLPPYLGGCSAPATVASSTARDADACTSPEETTHRQRFLDRTFSAPNFRPSAGYGQFDARYWPRLSLMAAVVKLHLAFVQAEDTPPLPDLVWRWARGEDLGRFFWNDAEKRRFERDYVEQVSRQWSARHRFRSVRPCWPFVAWPLVSPRIVADADDAHYEVVVYKMSSPGAFRGSGFRARIAGTPGWRGSGELDQNDVLTMHNRFSSDVARSERLRLERALAESQASPVRFGRDSTAIVPPFDARLRRLATALAARDPTAPLVPLVLSGFASAEGAREHNRRLSQARAEAVQRFLRDAGAPQPLMVVARGPVGVPGDGSNRRVEIAADRTFEQGYTGNRFLPAGHEFGHALGLPDEYRNYVSGNLADKQRAFERLARQAGVAPPDPWGRRTSSVMSVGMDVLPRHYLTLWEALGRMTEPDIRRDQWRIE